MHLHLHVGTDTLCEPCFVYRADDKSCFPATVRHFYRKRCPVQRVNFRAWVHACVLAIREADLHTLHPESCALLTLNDTHHVISNRLHEHCLSVSHDDPAPVALGRLVRHEGSVEVVEAETAVRAAIPPVAVVVVEMPRPAPVVTNLGFKGKGAVFNF